MLEPRTSAKRRPKHQHRCLVNHHPDFSLTFLGHGFVSFSDRKSCSKTYSLFSLFAGLRASTFSTNGLSNLPRLQLSASPRFQSLNLKGIRKFTQKERPLDSIPPPKEIREGKPGADSFKCLLKRVPQSVPRTIFGIKKGVRHFI